MAALGAAVSIGWAAHDLAVFATSGRPEICTVLVPGIGRAALVGAVLGACVFRYRAPSAAAIGIAAVAWARPGLFGFDPTTPGELSLAGSLVFALVAGMIATIALNRRASSAPSAAAFLGVVAGSVAAGVHTAGRVGLASVSLYAIGGTLASIGVAWFFRGAMRRSRVLALAVVLLAVIAGVAMQARRETHRVRADLAPPNIALERNDMPSAILIVLDTARADRMGMYGYEHDTTPRLDAFANDEATRYDSARSTAPWTLPSHASLFTGLYPAVHGVTIPRSDAPVDPDAKPTANQREAWGQPNTLSPEIPTLAERLRSRGVQTAAIVSNRMLGAWTGLDRGFEHYDDRKGAAVGRYQAFAPLRGRPELAGHTPYRDAREMTDVTLAWLDDERRANSPFFLFLNYMDVHNPYRPPPPFDTAFSDEQPRNRLRPEPELWSVLYDRELAYLDSEIGRLLDGLRARGLFEDTLIVITSDHGEAFGEHGTWIHGWSLHEEVVRVPLIVKPVQGRTIAVATEPTTGADVHDLILRELGVEHDPSTDALPGHVAESYYSDKVVMLAGLPGKKQSELAYDLVAWIEGSVKISVSSKGEVRAYDLALDPFEERPITLNANARNAALDVARGWWEAHPPPVRDDTPALDDETLDDLRRLGYAGGDG